MKLVFSFLVVCAFLRAGNISAVWANEGGDKVTQDELRVSHGTTNLTGSVINRAWNGTTVTLAGAKNEVLGFNLVLEAANATASNVTVSFTTLTGPNGATISSVPTTGNGVFNWTQRNIELFYARYVQIKGLSFFGYYKGDERQIPVRFRADSSQWTDRPDHDKMYPDPLVPLELVNQFNIASGTNQSIFVDIYIPGSAAPGTYTGTITVKEGATTSRTIPVSLTVYGFSLPDMPTAKTFVNLDAVGDIVKRFVDPSGNYVQWNASGGLHAVAVTDKYYQLFHRHKMSLIGDNDCPGADQPCDTSVRRLNGSLFTAANGYAGPGVSKSNDTYSIGTYGTWSWKDDQNVFNQHVDAWESWFEANAPYVERFLYLADEPSANSCNGQQFCTDIFTVQNWAQWLNSDPGPGHNLLGMSTYPFVWAQSQAPALDAPAMAGGIGACPRGQSTCDNTTVTQNSANYYSGTAGKRLWMYNDGHPGSGTWMTEADGTDPRTIPWAQYKKHVSRWYYWFANVSCCNDFFAQALTWGSYNRFDSEIGWTGDDGTSNGNGFIVYPGTDLANPDDSYGVDGPIASLRMKEYRRGIQDVDYLVLANQVNPTATQAIVNAAMPQALWENAAPGGDTSYFVGPYTWSSNPDDWEAKRAQLAAIIAPGSSTTSQVIPTPTSPIGQAGPAAWPDHVATPSDLLVAADHATTALSADVTSNATTIAVNDASLFVVNQVVLLEDANFEEVKITAKSGNNLTVIRGVAGTTAQPHSATAPVLGGIGAIYPNQITAELAAFENDRFGHIGSTSGVTPTAGPGTSSWPYHPIATGDLYVASDFADTNLSASVDATSLTLAVNAGGAFAPYELITIEREQMKVCAVSGTSLTICTGGRGLGGTTAAAHAVHAPVHARISATQIRRIASEISALQTDLFPTYGTGGTAVDLAWPNHAATTTELLASCSPTVNAACYNHMANEVMAVETSVHAQPMAGAAPGTPFATGFESSTALSPVPSGNGPSGVTQTFSGTDASTGYAWPFSGWTPAAFGIHVDPADGDTTAYTSHFANGLVSMTGHTGSTTTALHLNIQNYADGSCCAQTIFESTALGSPVTGYYLRAWVKWPASLEAQIQNNSGAWQSLWAEKNTNTYRQENGLAQDSRGASHPVWHMYDDVLGWSASNGDANACRYVDPNTGTAARDCTPFFYNSTVNTAVAPTFGDWFLMELYIKRSKGSDGRFFMAINGQTLADYTSPYSYGYGNEDVFNMYNFIAYANHFPIEMWVDDIYIADRPPCTTLPCGANGTGVTSTSPLPPFISSPMGAIGTVGSSFSYQTVAANNVSTYQAFGLPSGLSINSSTGLISGTPTTAGRYVVDVRAIGSGGYFDKDVVILINQSSGTPTITSFSASQTSIAAGQSVTLSWATTNATTVAVQPTATNTDGTVTTGSQSVAPARTTTYILAATNSAGTVQNTVTVTVH